MLRLIGRRNRGRVVLWLLCILAAIALDVQSAGGQARAAGGHSEQQGTAVVSIRVVDVWGRSLPCRVVSFVDRRTRRDYSSSFQGPTAASIPHGRYDYSVIRTASGHELNPIKGSLTVTRPETATTLVSSSAFDSVGGRPASFDVFTPKDFHLTAEVRLPQSCEMPWLRLESVVQAHVLEATVDHDGLARFFEPPEGVYAAVLSCKDRVVSATLISFEQGTSSTRFRIPFHTPATVVRIVPDVARRP